MLLWSSVWWQYHAVEKPRPYHVVALFTATASKYQCLKCR